MKFLKDQKGSTLMLVVITVAILSLLGTALLSMSLMNINMKHNDKRVKTSQYYAESGIDQVYAYIGKLVQDDIELALTNTDIQLNTMIQLINTTVERLETGAIDTTHSEWTAIVQYVDETAVDSGEYVLNMTKLEEDSNDWYLTNFKTIINNHVDDGLDATTYKTLIENGPYADVNLNGDDLTRLTIAVGSSDKFIMASSGEQFRINDIQVSYTDQSNTVKTISTDIVISDEISDFPISTIENRIVIPDNPLWQQAIVTNGFIVIDNANVEIEGDVYGYGKIPSSSDTITSIEGVRVSNGGNATIDGNVYSRGYVQVADGASRLRVNNGLVYANSVLTQNDATNGSIVVNGNVYTQDDLELNGANSDITINGSYYGYTDGSAIGGSHDKSSAIIINEDMIGETLTITGSLPGGTTVDYTENFGVSVPIEGILIGGTAYVNIADRYQTAESVSLRKNYIAYTWAFSEATRTALTDAGATDFLAGDRYNFFVDPSHATNLANRTAAVDRALDLPESQWNEIEESPGVKLAEPSTLDDRKLYFASFDKAVDAGSGFINKGNGNVNLSNYIYTRGLQLYNDQFSDDQKMMVGAGEFGDSQFNTLSNKIIKDYVHQLNQLSHSELADPLTVVDTVNGVIPQDTAELNALNVVYKYSKIEEGIIASNQSVTVAGETNIVDIAKPNATQIKYIKIESGNNLEIWGDGHGRSVPVDTTRVIDSGEYLQGIIICNGDIHIYGDLEFAGPIITSGNLYIHSGTVKLYNDSNEIDEYLKNLINQDSQTALYELFDVESYGSESGSVTIDTIEEVEILDGTQKDATASNSIYDYREILYFEHWKIVR